jgi:hypothetical protein
VAQLLRQPLSVCTEGPIVSKIIRDGYEIPGRPSREEFHALSLEERLALPPATTESIPTWAIEPDARRRQFLDLAPRIEEEDGPGAVIKARAELERAIQADEVLWERYLVSKQHRATA